MENNPMKLIYEHFGKEKEENQEMLNISNVFYEMGRKEGRIHEKQIDISSSRRVSKTMER